MKRVLFLMSIVLFLLPVICFAVVPKSNYVYVSDYADVLKDNTKSYIIQNSSFLKKETKVEYYVVTVPKLNGEDVDQYANQLYDSFCSNNRGVIVLFAKKERVLKVILGSELSKIFSNDKIDEYIQSYFMPFFKNDEWDLGLLNGYNAFYKDIGFYYNLDTSDIKILDGKDFLTKYKTFILLFIAWIATTITYVCCIYFLKLYKGNHTSKVDDFVFIFMFFTNALLLGLTYWIDPDFLLILVGIEVVCFIFIYLSLANHKKEKKRKLVKRKKTIKRKKK